MKRDWIERVCERVVGVDGCGIGFAIEIGREGTIGEGRMDMAGLVRMKMIVNLMLDDVDVHAGVGVDVNVGVGVLVRDHDYDDCD